MLKSKRLCSSFSLYRILPSRNTNLFGQSKFAKHIGMENYCRNLIAFQKQDKQDPIDEQKPNNNPSEKSLFDKLQESLPNIPSMPNINIDTKLISEKISKEINTQLEKEINIENKDLSKQKKSQKAKKEPLSLTFKLGVIGFVVFSIALWYYSPNTFFIVFTMIKGAVKVGGEMALMLLKLIPIK